MDLPLIGRGRAADVFDLGNGRVLRRYRSPRPGQVEIEAATMRMLHAAGAPVPEVFAADGSDIVMEKVAGRSMLDEIAARPWRTRSLGRRLGELHATLLALRVGATEGLPTVGEGDSLLHLDFHPGNVMVDGPDATIIDWTNAARGPAGADVAMSWMLIATSSPDETEAPALLRRLAVPVRRVFVNAYLAATAEVADVPAWIPHVCARRLADPNTRPAEATEVRRFLSRHSGG